MTNDDDKTTTTRVSASLAWNLLELVAASSKDNIIEEPEDDDNDLSLSLSYSHGRILPTVLQLWRLERQEEPQRRKNSSNSNTNDDFMRLPSPQHILQRLDDWRMAATTTTMTTAGNTGSGGLLRMVVDVQCYNIFLAGCCSPNSWKLAHHVYQWMWQESLLDGLVQPDHVTLRTMIQATVQQKTQQQQYQEPRDISKACLDLVHEYFSKKKGSINDDDDDDEDGADDWGEGGSAYVYPLLIHTLARIDPYQAQYFLQEMANQHLEYRQNGGRPAVSSNTHNTAHHHHHSPPPPPSVKDWNVVISALAMDHGQPLEAEHVLEHFVQFSRDQAERVSHELRQASEMSLILNNQYTQDQHNRRLDQVVRPDVTSYTSIIEGWGRLGESDQAYRVYQQFLSMTDDTNPKTYVQPNIVTFTSALKAQTNKVGLSSASSALSSSEKVQVWNRIQAIAQDCLQRADSANIATTTEDDWNENTSSVQRLDAGFFHAWLEACATIETLESLEVAQSIVTDLMPSHGISPSKLSYSYLLQCFMKLDDLEGATQWLLKHLEEMDQATLVEWTLELTKLGDIELVSFFDKFRLIAGTPKTLLQVLIRDGHLNAPNVVEHLLRNIPVTQQLQVLKWIPSQTPRRPSYFAIVMWSLFRVQQSTSSSTTTPYTKEQAQQLEDLWEVGQDQTRNRMTSIDSDDKDDWKEEDRKALKNIYTTLLMAWSRANALERVQYWYDALLQDPLQPLISRAAATAVLSCHADCFQPSQAETIWEDLYDLHKAGRLLDPPDVFMLNTVLKAWKLAACGSKAAACLDHAQQGHHHHHVSDGEVVQLLQGDAISYNTVVQAYVRGRELDAAQTYVETNVGVVADFPNVITLRILLDGWKRHRQDYELAWKRATKLVDWMTELHHQQKQQQQQDKKGTGSSRTEDPSKDNRIMRLMEVLTKRVVDSRKKEQQKRQKEDLAKKKETMDGNTSIRDRSKRNKDD